MADPSLNNPVVIQASRIDPSILPLDMFSQAYVLAIIAQGSDLGNVANKANESGSAAYDAQVKNEEQDITLADHDGRITANTNAIALIDVRLITAEGQIVTLRSDTDYLLSEVIFIESDMISKSKISNQSVQSSGGAFIVGSVVSPTADKLQVEGSANVSASYKVLGTKVIGTRRTGWTAAIGDDYRDSFNSSSGYSVSSTYQQSEIIALRNALQETRKRLKSLESDVRAHGLIDG